MNQMYKIILVIISITIKVFAQYGVEDWVRTYSNFDSTAASVNIAVDSAGNIYQTGSYLDPVTFTNIVTIKYNSKGERLWLKEFNGNVNADEQPASIAVDKIGNIIVAGDAYVSDSTGYDYIVLKYSSDGKQEWVKSFSGIGDGYDQANNICTDDSLNIYVTGYSFRNNTYEDIMTIKLNNKGDELWRKRFDGGLQSHNQPTSILLDDSSNVYVIGFSDSAYTSQNIIILKYTNTGQLLWQKRPYKWPLTQGKSLINSTDSDGNLYVCASVSKSLNENVMLILKYDSNGNLDQELTYNNDSSLTVIPGKVRIDENQNVYVAGYFTSEFLLKKFFLIKYNNSGILDWVRTDTLSDFNYFVAQDVFLDNNLNTYLVGWTEKGFVASIITMKFNSEEKKEWTQYYTKTNSISNFPNKILVKNSDVFVSGWSGGDAETWKEFTLIKYTQTNGPWITSIKDIPNDQGGWVNVKFIKNINDTDSLKLSKSSNAELYTVEINDGHEWVAAASTAAYGKYLYSVLVPTTKDSTSQSNGIIDFRVIAGMDEGNFTGNIAAGYSVDNLKPSAPQALKAIINEQSVELRWLPVRDADFQYFRIYKSGNESGFKKIGSTIDTFYIDKDVSMDKAYNYFVKTVDYSGNESDSSKILNIIFTNISDENKIPVEYNLAQNYPNPFNPETMIKYSVKKTGLVTIKVFNLLGQEVKTLVNDVKEPGFYEFNFTTSGLASGVYIYKMQADSFISTKKFILLK